MTDTVPAPASSPKPSRTNALSPLYGLVLAGGASKRMQRDKATLEYRGRPQLECAYELLARYCERAFVSVRLDQVRDPLRAKFPQVVDTLHDVGPIAGLAAAQETHAQVAWLVLACDLPFVSSAAIEHLIAARDGVIPVAYRSAHDGLPEPLCAIYEPGSHRAVTEAIASGKFCPRKLLIRLGAPLLALPDPVALDNVNTPDEFAKARSTLSDDPTESRA
jgi:molybdopterin-guanine dinucleotide biosynthesis protein A